jgi:hypothetical protein
MTKNLNEASWEDIIANPGVIPLDHRCVLYLDTGEIHATYLLELNRLSRTLLIKKLSSATISPSQSPLSYYPYLLLNPDFEGLKVLIRIRYNASRKSLEFDVAKKADNSLFSILILQVDDVSL